MDGGLLSRPTCQHPSASQFSEIALTHQADDKLQHFSRRAMCVPLLGLPGTCSSRVQPHTNPPTSCGWLLDTREGQHMLALSLSLSLSLTLSCQPLISKRRWHPQLGSLAGCSALIEMSPQRSQRRQEVPSVHLPCHDVRLG